MSKYLRIIALIMALTMVLMCTGCWDYEDVESLFVVAGIGVEYSDSGQYRTTFEVGKASLSPDEENTVRTPTADGDTLFDCIRNVIGTIGSKLYWGHTNVLIIHSEVAEDGIIEVLGTFDRSAQLNSEVIIAISTDKPMVDFFSVKDPIHNTNSYHIVDLFEAQEASGKFIKRELMETIADIANDTGSLTLPLFHLEKEGEEDAIVAGGSAVFRGDKMIGYLSEIETRSMAILKGDIHENYTMTVGSHDNIPPITAEVKKSSRKINVKLRDGIPTFYIHLHLTCDVVSLQSSVDYITDERISVMEKRLEKQLRDELMRTIDKAQMELRSDIFYFGDFVFDQYPEYWRTFEPNWNDQFVYAYFDTFVEIDLNYSGTTVKPIRQGS